jgi:TolA-binding protein
MHRLTLRQINENPTLMSDEVFVPAEEVAAVEHELAVIKQVLADPEQIHYQMLRGAIARISMSQCAHTWGAQAVAEWNRAQELRADLKTVSDVLKDYEGDHVWQQAQDAIENIHDMRHTIRRIQSINESNVLHIGDLEADLRDAKREIEKLRHQLANREPNTEGFTDVEAQEQGPRNSEQERQG